jgi:hypothetical protein
METRKANKFREINCLISFYGSASCPLDLGLFFRFLNIYTNDRTPWKEDQPVSKPLPTHRTTQTQNKRTETHTYIRYIILLHVGTRKRRSYIILLYYIYNFLQFLFINISLDAGKFSHSLNNFSFITCSVLISYNKLFMGRANKVQI